jgi:hypothetical protein
MDTINRKTYGMTYKKTARRVMILLSTFFLLLCNSSHISQPQEVTVDLFGSIWNDRTADGRLFGRMLLQSRLKSCPETGIKYARTIKGSYPIGSVKPGDTLMPDSTIIECDHGRNICHALTNLQLFVQSINDSAFSGKYSCTSDTGMRSGGFLLAICNSNPHLSIIGQDTFNIGDCWTYCEADTHISGVMLPPRVHEIYTGIHTIRIIDTITEWNGRSYILSILDSGMNFTIRKTDIGSQDSIRDSSEMTVAVIDTINNMPLVKGYQAGFPNDPNIPVNANYVLYHNDTLILESRGTYNGSQYAYLQKIGYLKSTRTIFTMEHMQFYHLNLISYNGTPFDSTEIKIIEYE